MSRQVSMYLHLAAMLIGQLATSNLIGLAAKAFHWPEEYKDFLVACVFFLQGIAQAAVSYVAQSFNTDGSKPGDRTLTKVIESQPGHMDKEITIETEKVTKKAQE